MWRQFMKNLPEDFWCIYLLLHWINNFFLKSLLMFFSLSFCLLKNDFGHGYLVHKISDWASVPGHALCRLLNSRWGHCTATGPSGIRGNLLAYYVFAPLHISDPAVHVSKRTTIFLVGWCAYLTFHVITIYIYFHCTFWLIHWNFISFKVSFIVSGS